MIEQKGMPLDHDFVFSSSRFIFPPKKREEERENVLTKIVIKLMPFCSINLDLIYNIRNSRLLFICTQNTNQNSYLFPKAAPNLLFVFVRILSLRIR